MSRWKIIAAFIACVFLWEHIARSNEFLDVTPSHYIGVATTHVKSVFYWCGYYTTVAVSEIIKHLNLNKLGESFMALASSCVEFVISWAEFFKGWGVAALLYDRTVQIVAGCVIVVVVFGAVYWKYGNSLFVDFRAYFQDPSVENDPANKFILLSILISIAAGGALHSAEE